MCTWFQIPVDDIVIMPVIYTGENLFDDMDSLKVGDGHGELIERNPIEEVHDDVASADGLLGADIANEVGVTEQRENFDFLVEMIGLAWLV